MISELLSQRHQELDVKLLLYAIQRASIFEEQLSKRYSGVTLVPDAVAEIPEEIPTNPFEEEDNSSTGAGSQSEYSETKMDKKLEQKKKNPFNKLISKSFSPYLSIYVKSQERNLSELIQRFLTDFDNEISQTVEGTWAKLANFNRKKFLIVFSWSYPNKKYFQAVLIYSFTTKSVWSNAHNCQQVNLYSTWAWFLGNTYESTGKLFHYV